MNILLLILNTIISRWSIVFITSLAISWIILRLLKKKNYGFVLTFAHILFISYIAAYIYIIRENEMAVFFWQIPFVYDMPISFLIISIPYTLAKIFPPSLLDNPVVVPYICYILLGTFQYYVIGRIIDSIILKTKNKK